MDFTSFFVLSKQAGFIETHLSTKSILLLLLILVSTYPQTVMVLYILGNTYVYNTLHIFEDF